MKRLLIIGCGDVIRRNLPNLLQRFRVYILVRQPEMAQSLRALGAHVIIGDLDQPATLRRVSGLGEWVIHSAPPPGQGLDDPRTRRLLAALAQAGMVPQRLAYISTSGVYGDCQGALIQETRPLHPANARAHRRVDAERQIRAFARRQACQVSIFRAPGIYAEDRLPLSRLQSGTPAILAEEDAYSNHVHALDLARLTALGLFRARNCRAYHACDGEHHKMGDYFDQVADAAGLDRPSRISRQQAQETLSPTLLSFMNESRRLSNLRLISEIRYCLRYPTLASCLLSFRERLLDKSG